MGYASFAWHKRLGRRSQRVRIPQEDYERLLNRYSLPPPRLLHSVYRLLAKSVI